MVSKKKEYKEFWRRRLVLGLICLYSIVLICRAFYLQYHATAFLETEGDNRYVRNIKVPAIRGTIYDRNMQPIATSTEVRSIWTDPSILIKHPEYFPVLARMLGMSEQDFTEMIEKRQKRRFYWLKRHLSPYKASIITQLGAPGIYESVEYKRYYPDAEITSHLLGFTNIDDEGIEGIELTYNEWLRGDNSYQRIIKDAKNRVIKILGITHGKKEGEDLVLTIDRRVQIVAYRALKNAVFKHKAKGGTLIVADAKSGEILAMVSQPAGNPNKMSDRKAELLKNRAISDVFEPGSTIKPFIVAAGLQSGLWKPTSIINTGYGFQIGRNTVRDVSRSNQMDVTTVIIKSSNIGVSKIALSLDRKVIWDLFKNLEIDRRSHLNLKGEQVGTIGDLFKWQRDDFEYATKSFGYGISLNTLKLAQIYTVFANHGEYRPLRLIKNEPPIAAKRIFDVEVADQVLYMLEGVLDKKRGGSGWRASVDKFRVGGKSGTIRKIENGRYTDQKHRSYFVGIAPVSDPQYVVAVMIDESTEGGYYGGLIAAPVISEVMGNTLRIMGAKPDAITTLPKLQLISQ